MAALSKIFAVVTTYPYQVVRARLQDQHNTYSGVLDVVRRTWRYDSDLGSHLCNTENIEIGDQIRKTFGGTRFFLNFLLYIFFQTSVLSVNRARVKKERKR